MQVPQADLAVHRTRSSTSFSTNRTRTSTNSTKYYGLTRSASLGCKDCAAALLMQERKRNRYEQMIPKFAD